MRNGMNLGIPLKETKSGMVNLGVIPFLIPLPSATARQGKKRTGGGQGRCDRSRGF